MSTRYRSLYANFSRRNNGHATSGSWLPARGTAVLILALFLSGSLGKIYLDRQTAKMRQGWSDQNDKLLIVSKETENLELELERYLGGNFVLPRARQQGLRPSEPGQVRFLRIQDLDARATDSVIASK